MSVMRDQRGFTLVEMLVSMLVMMVVTAAVFGLVDPAQGVYRAQPEVSDMQQRLRVAVNTLEEELMMAGAGTYSGGVAGGALLNVIAPVLPRRGLADTVPYRPDAITVMYIHTAAQTTIEHEMPAPSSELRVVDSSPGCPPDKKGDEPCGFRVGQRAVVFDATSFDVFTITHVQNSNHLQHKDDLSKAYGVGAQIAAMSTRTYYWHSDDSTSTYQLRYSDGEAIDEPMVDNVVALSFQYFGEPRPPVMLKSITEAAGPYTSNGPKPPASGENCIFVPGTPLPEPRLTALGPGDTLVELSEATLTTGPKCPSDSAAQRFDADLLRIRRIGVRLRVQVASATLRGPAGALFAKGGYSKGGVTWVPDQEISFDVTPRNLNLGR
jgi:prepilin-type N-terminal cleavage/methylation domain-containing protein